MEVGKLIAVGMLRAGAKESREMRSMCMRVVLMMLQALVMASCLLGCSSTFPMKLGLWDEAQGRAAAKELEHTCEVDLDVIGIRRQGNHALMDVVFRFPRSEEGWRVIQSLDYKMDNVFRSFTTDDGTALPTSDSDMTPRSHRPPFFSPFTMHKRAYFSSSVDLFTDETHKYILAELPLECKEWPKDIEYVRFRVSKNVLMSKCPVEPREERVRVVYTKK